MRTSSCRLVTALVSRSSNTPARPWLARNCTVSNPNENVLTCVPNVDMASQNRKVDVSLDDIEFRFSRKVTNANNRFTTEEVRMSRGMTMRASRS